MEHSELVVLWALTAARFLYVIHQRRWAERPQATRESGSTD
jgi:hypothetical protein